MRRSLIAGNWKLHNTLAQSRELATGLARELADISDIDIVVAPVYTAIATVAEQLKDSPVAVAAQNCYPEETGAFTGEVSPLLLKDAGCRYVIIGHSERRQLFNETDRLINQKIIKVLDSGLLPILCIGETLAERQNEQTLDVLAGQLKQGLAQLSAAQLGQLIIAYEPVWAIGTGVTASNEQAQEAHSFIRGVIQGLSTPEIAAGCRILYGGSVKPDNVDGLLAQDDIDGALVGGASLKLADFVRIVRFER
jgi:triosephosphate isomerase